MKLSAPRTGAAAWAAALFVSFGAPAHGAAPDSLTLQAPTALKAWSVYDAQARRFAVWLTWREAPDSVSTFITPVDTTGWSVTTPPAQLSLPSVRGAYNGDIDRTVLFHAPTLLGGEVGVDPMTITFEIRREEFYNGSLQLTAAYVPGTWLPLRFRDQRNGQVVDFGLEIRFSAGRIDALGGFMVGLEDFEGFHIWRGIRPDGSDLEVIGELSKEEASKGSQAGGNPVDSVYFYDILPTLRTSPPWISPFGSIECLGTRIDLPLDPGQLFWFDCNGANGFTYYYGVTTFDRGYEFASGQQGLTKVDNCPVAEGTPYPCRGQLETVEMEVDAQSDLHKVYVVPNPVRTGTSRLTTDNYHNFPDGLVRFVNLPPNCTIRIFTVSGELVWLNEHADGTGNVEWDTRNLEEEDVASGVYVYRIESDSDSVYGRIVVIR